MEADHHPWSGRGAGVETLPTAGRLPARSRGIRQECVGTVRRAASEEEHTMKSSPRLESSSRDSYLEQMRALDRHWEEVNQSIQHAEQQVTAFQRCLANARHILLLEPAETASPSALLVKRVAWLEEQVTVTNQRLQDQRAERARLEHGFDVARCQLATLQRQGRQRRALRRQRVARFARPLCRGLVLIGQLLLWLLCGPLGDAASDRRAQGGGLYLW
jgi:hypothetical protein